MQFSASYIGHLFQLDKNHDCGNGVVLTKDMVGTLKAINLQLQTMLLEFPMSKPGQERVIKAWIPETSVLLFASNRPSDAGVPPIQAGTPLPLPALKPWKDRFAHGLVSVKSDNIDQMGIFTPDDLDATKVNGVRAGLLVVVFKKGTAYSYLGVDVDTFEAMKAAPSITKYFNAHIKGNDWMHPTKLED